MSRRRPRLRRRERIWPPLLVLGLIYGAVVAAPWLAPYEYYEQNRSLPLAPPTWPHFVDDEGRWHLRPFVYRLEESEETWGEYIEDRSERFPLRFGVEAPLVPGQTPRRFGPLEVSHRLFGVDPEARVLLFGTDRLGRDQLSRFLYGGRASLGAGLLAALVAAVLSLGVGTVAGFYGGFVDHLLMRIGDFFMAFPWLYLLIAVRAFMPLETEPMTGFLVMILLIALLGWVQPARLVRGVVLAARRRDFVRAARGFGASDLYLLRRHVLPQAWSVLLTYLAILVPRLVLAEVTLSFLGLGIAEPMPSWGKMLADLQHYHVVVSSWWLAWPAVALIAVILSYHHLADALRRRWAVSLTL